MRRSPRWKPRSGSLESSGTSSRPSSDGWKPSRRRRARRCSGCCGRSARAQRNPSHLVARTRWASGRLGVYYCRMSFDYDVIVVGAGHAGCEAAVLSARLGARALLEGVPTLELVQGMVSGLLLDGGRASGVRTADGRSIRARAVVLTAGTFLRGRIHLGTDTQIPAGRAGDQPAVAIAEHIESLGLTALRFKTGTPPRVDGRSVDWSKVERQDGDGDEYRFSSYDRAV